MPRPLLPRVRVLAAALVLLPVLALVLPHGGAQAQETVFVNVVTARSAGCSPDTFTKPDLRVRVYANGALLHETVKAQDTGEPLYANLTSFRAALPLTLGVEVQEAEPGGFLGLGTSWVDCDAAPGPATRFEASYSGATQRLVARGDGADAAEATVVVGRDAPAVAAPRVVDATASEATLAWTGDAKATAHRLAGGGYGAVLAVAGRGNGTAALRGLCDNQDYAVRLVRDQEPWSVASADVVVRTLNVAPQPPQVTESVKGASAFNVTWSAPTTHDVRAFEVHAGPTAQFQPGAATLRRSAQPAPFAPQHETDVPLQAGDAFVRIRAVDTGGLVADSPALALGARQDAPPAPAQSCSAIGSVDVTTGAAPPPADAGTTGADATAGGAPTTGTTGGATATTPPPTQGTARETDDEGGARLPDGGGSVSVGLVVAIALGAAALGGVLVLALRR